MNRLEQIEARLKAGYHHSVKDTGVGSISEIALADAEADLAALLAVAGVADAFLSDFETEYRSSHRASHLSARYRQNWPTAAGLRDALAPLLDAGTT